MRSVRSFIVGVLVLTVSILLSGCGASGGSSSTPAKPGSNTLQVTVTHPAAVTALLKAQSKLGLKAHNDEHITLTSADKKTQKTTALSSKAPGAASQSYSFTDLKAGQYTLTAASYTIADYTCTADIDSQGRAIDLEQSTSSTIKYTCSKAPPVKGPSVQLTITGLTQGATTDVTFTDTTTPANPAIIVKGLGNTAAAQAIGGFTVGDTYTVKATAPTSLKAYYSNASISINQDASKNTETINFTSPKIVAVYMMTQDIKSAADLTTHATKIISEFKNYKGIKPELMLSFVKPHLSFTKQAANPLATINSETGFSFPQGTTFAAVQTFITTLKQAGISVFISVGGWDYSCAINKDGYDLYHEDQGGSIYCEPPQAGYAGPDYTQNPTPTQSDLKAAAVQDRFDYFPNPSASYNQALAKGYTNPESYTAQNDQAGYIKSWVDLAKFLGADGVDLDYEETWHADLTSITGGAVGSHFLPYTAEKFGDITQVLDNYAKSQNIKVAMAIVPVGATDITGGNGLNYNKWWGGNMKGLYYCTIYGCGEGQVQQTTYPDVFNGLDHIGVMTYDLDTNLQSGYCAFISGGLPTYGSVTDSLPAGFSAADCQLGLQTQAYMQFAKNLFTNTLVIGGIEIGQPAYPGPTQNAGYMVPFKSVVAQAPAQMVYPLTTIADIKKQTANGVIVWELDKTTALPLPSEAPFWGNVAAYGVPATASDVIALYSTNASK